VETEPADAVTLRRHGPRAALALRETVVEIHAEVHAELPFGRDRYFGSEAFRGRLMVGVWQPRFELCLAETHDGRVAGLLYGWALPPYTRWWRPVEAVLPPELTAEDGERSVFIQEIMVRTPWRRQGVARRMHDFFLAGRTERRGLMCVLPDNEPAVGAYRRWGWRTVVTAPFAPDEPTFDCMVLDQPRRLPHSAGQSARSAREEAS
jgi:ribosomal protein S18 acetylase RimI-like enzyme